MNFLTTKVTGSSLNGVCTVCGWHTFTCARVFTLVSQTLHPL